MGLNWPGIQAVGGDMESTDRKAVKELLDEFADRAHSALQSAEFPLHASPLWRPWNLVVVRDAEKVLAAFSPLQGGTASVKWLDRSQELYPAEALALAVVNELGMSVTALVVLPRPESPQRKEAVAAAVIAHLAGVERAQRLGRLGDLTGLRHLEPSLRAFLAVHPDPERNVFVMMRFLQSEQMREIHGTIKATLAERGFHAVRTDDRDYTGELWSNVEVYMACSMYGIAVFEDIQQRDFNPNVSLELGYMLGRRRRCLILKEERLPNLPADVVHRLYKPFDMFDIPGSIAREVGRWIDVDLGVADHTT